MSDRTAAAVEAGPIVSRTASVDRRVDAMPMMASARFRRSRRTSFSTLTVTYSGIPDITMNPP